MGLKEEYDISVKEIKTEEYAMSLGEIANMYKDGDLTIFPEYQRYFRWKDDQKSSFIESIILGIPTPSIFVSSDENSKWDVIDGLQRISTILEFMGILKNPNTGNYYEPSKLLSTKFLPSLKGKYWDKTNDTIGPNFRRLIKRRKIGIIIIDSSSNSDIKYEFFRRLNTNGEPLSIQEIRNVSILMTNNYLFKTINKLISGEPFKNVLHMTENKLDRQEDKDWVSEFFVSLYITPDQIDTSLDMGNMITSKLVDIAKEISDTDIDEISEKFEKTVDLINGILGEDAFKKYNEKSGKYSGAALQSMFEVVFNLTYNQYDYFYNNPTKLKDIQKNIPNDMRYKNATAKGTRSVDRMKKMKLFVSELESEIRE